MREATLEQRGSPSRDAFKYKHKNLLPGWCWSCDIDFALVSKNPPSVVAFLDYQVGEEAISFSEVLAYNRLMEIAPMFIVRGDHEACGPFDVFEYEGGDWRPEPPHVTLLPVLQGADWAGLSRWEQSLRIAYETAHA